MTCTIIWELHNPFRTLVLTALVQNSIWIVCQIFTLAALLIFVLCGQVLIAYHQRAVKELEHWQLIEGQNSNEMMEGMWLILSQFRPLFEVRHRLYKDFRFILLTNVCLSLVTILTATYYELFFMWIPHASKCLSNVWDIGDIAESFIRLWLICHINDCLHSSVCFYKHFILLALPNSF